jgi:hypothetical protein
MKSSIVTLTITAVTNVLLCSSVLAFPQPYPPTYPYYRSGTNSVCDGLHVGKENLEFNVLSRRHYGDDMLITLRSPGRRILVEFWAPAYQSDSTVRYFKRGNTIVRCIPWQGIVEVVRNEMTVTTNGIPRIVNQ